MLTIWRCIGDRVTLVSSTLQDLETDMSLVITIRPATIADRPDIARVHQESIRGLGVTHYTPEQIAGWSGNISPEKYPVDTERMIVAMVGDRAAGFGELHLKTNELRAVYVSPEFAGRGVGTMILNALEEIARENGLTNLHLGASLNAVSFYEKHGWCEISRDRKMKSNGVELPYVSMVKTWGPYKQIKLAEITAR